MIKEDYVSWETGKLMGENGFDQDYPNAYYDCRIIDGVYIAPVPRPTLQTAMKWLREEKGVAVVPVISSVLDNEKFLWDVKIVVAKTNDTYSQGWVYEKQEDACERAVKYCLENLI